MNDIRNATEAFAVPGEDHFIDIIAPSTGRSLTYGHTLEQVRESYPAAEVVEIAPWLEAKAKRQRSPITWAPCTKERYWYFLEILPPAAMHGGGFLVGEPMDHDAGNGQERFEAFRQMRGETYAKASRPMTRAEFALEMGARVVKRSEVQP
jgi:hypothetical protein